MIKTISNKVWAAATLGLVGVLSFALINSLSAKGNEGGARKIVVFAEEFNNEHAQRGLLKHFAAEDLGQLPLVNGRVVILPPKATAALERRREVLLVEDDVVVHVLGRKDNPGKGNKPKEPAPDISQPPEEPSWGFERIGGNATALTGAGVKVGIIDTGVNVSHPDLKVAGGVNTINPLKSYNDDNGHGTHVAGIIAALQNEIGVRGLSSDAEVYAIKSLNHRGRGYVSDIIEGLGFAVDNNLDVVNMSLGTRDNIASFHVAIKAAHLAGVTIVAAAGNEGDSDGFVEYPGRYPETIAVSATSLGDEVAWFSSAGAAVDLAAPGDSINSTWKADDYKEKSGTSMAAPHVAGVVALILEQNGALLPDEVKAKLINSAEDLGELGRDDLFGAGLVSVPGALE